MNTEVDKRITKIRGGESVRGDIQVFLAGGKLSPEAKEQFVAALRQAPEPQRERLVKALLAIGRMADPAYQPGGMLLRDPGVIEVLATEGLSKPSTARDATIEALLNYVPVELLTPHGAAILGSLKASPDADSFLLVAKAKPAGARGVVVDYAADASWGKEEAVHIAMAAFGDTAEEQKIIKRFVDAPNPEEKGKRARALAEVGTTTSLRALASEMRTDAIYEMKMTMERSIRVDIVAALSFAFPDKPFLWDNAVHDDAGYARIEEFCEKTFGIKWTKPRPPFLWIQGFPASR